MNNNFLVTITIPTYNRCIFLKRTLESVINQTYKNIEIIVSDNCSEDNTENMMLEYVKKDSRIRYYRQKENMGIGFQGEFLLGKAKGKYCCLCCDDDYLSENYVEECVNILLNNPCLSFSYGTVNLIDEDGKIEKKCETFYAEQNSFEERIEAYVKNGISNFIASVFMETDLYKKVTLDYEKNRFCEDQLHILKALYYGKCVCSDKAIYYKLNNGCTKDLETLKNAFNLKGMTHKNYWKYLANAYKESVLNDGFYDDKMSKKERCVVANVAYKAVKDRFKATNSVSFGQRIIDMIRGKHR